MRLALLLLAACAGAPRPPAVSPPAPSRSAASASPTAPSPPPSPSPSTPSVLAQNLIGTGNWLPSPEEQQRAAADSLQRARAAIDIGDFDGAGREAQSALYADPGNVDASVLLARAQFALGNPARAEAVARATVALPGGDQQATLWMILGLTADRDDRTDEAVAAYEKATALRPDYAAAWTNLGAIYLRQESLALAVDAFERALALRPDSAAAHCNLGSALRARTADFASDPDRPRATALLERALDEYAAALERDVNYAPAVFNLALLHLDGEASAELSRKEQLEAAVQLFERYQDLIKQQRRGSRAPPNTPADEYLATARSLLAKTATP